MYRLKYENIEKIVESEVERDKLINKGYTLCEEKKSKKGTKASGEVE